MEFVIVLGMVTVVPFVVCFFGGIGLWAAKRVMRPDQAIQITIDSKCFEEEPHE